MTKLCIILTVMPDLRETGMNLNIRSGVILNEVKDLGINNRVADLSLALTYGLCQRVNCIISP